MLPKNQNPYYDSVRDKPDRSEFASLSMDLQEKPKRTAARGWLNVVIGLVGIVVIAVFVKRLFV